MNYNDLNPELQEKVAACNTPEEIFALASEEGYELNEEELEQVSGGTSWNPKPKCPNCGSDDIGDNGLFAAYSYRCNACGKYFS